MNAHKLKATIQQDGTLLLHGLPFHPGSTVEIIILEQPDFSDAATEPETNDYLAGFTQSLSEWTSDADEAAYHDL
ncbi:MAG: hypothetical protein AAGD09_20985 [Cyanobacteria bacterium P01_F01_bin.56]